MDPVVLDASVVLGLLDPADGHHAAALASVRRSRSAGHPLVLPASAFAEVLVGASRVGREAVNQTEAFVDAVIDLVHPIDPPVAKEAALIRSGTKALRLPDALVIAVGRVLGASSILTADAGWRTVDQRVQVIS